MPEPIQARQISNIVLRKLIQELREHRSSPLVVASPVCEARPPQFDIALPPDALTSLVDLRESRLRFCECHFGFVETLRFEMLRGLFNEDANFWHVEPLRQPSANPFHLVELRRN